VKFHLFVSARNLRTVTDEAVCVCEIASLDADERNLAMTEKLLSSEAFFAIRKVLANAKKTFRILQEDFQSRKLRKVL
jgi:hypothetical protein